MVNLLKRYTGRGPTYARTYIDDGLIVTVFQDTMTIAEQTLRDEGQPDTVKHLREVFEGALRDEAIATVERLTGQRIVAFLSDHAVEPDYAVEVFIVANAVPEPVVITNLDV